MKNLFKLFSSLFFFAFVSMSFNTSAFALDNDIKLIKDINNIEKGSSPSSFLEVNGTLFFKANDNYHGEELWKSDGTTNGTTLVKDINPGPTGSSIGKMINFNNILYFTANDGTSGLELWKSDGTAEGTVLVKDIYSGSIGSSPDYLTVMGGNFYFKALGVSLGYELWKSDGTTDGTILVKDIKTGSSSSYPQDLIEVNNKLFFTANVESPAYDELWVSDGTTNGTVKIKGYNEFGGTLWFARNFFNYNGTLLFAVELTNYSMSLWKSDGTSGGTVLVKSFSYRPEDFVIFNDIVYFDSGEGGAGGGSELWKTDGTTGGTVLVKDIYVGANFSNPNYLTVLGDKIIFSAATELGYELWRSDGTTDGTVLIKDIYTGSTSSSPGNLTVMGDSIYFKATSDSIGLELWKSDGTTEGTVLVKDIYTGTGNSANVNNLYKFGNEIFFSAYTYEKGTELYKTDGTTNGTILLKNINLTTESADPSTLITIGDVAVFAATSAEGRELWKTDKTSEGTVLVKDINVGVANSNPTAMKKFGNNVYFSADDGIHGYELWKSDGTTNGTVLVKDIRPGSSDSGIQLISVTDNNIFFYADDGTHGKELWKSDGTTNGTVLVKDITVGSGQSYFLNGILTPIDSKVYFTTYTPSSGYEIWVSDGSESGTYQIKDIYPGTSSSAPGGYFKFNDSIFFYADDGTVGTELWRTDGSESGTYLVKDINEGIYGSSPNNFFLYNDIVLFRANGELWKTDGTSQGTVLIKSLYTGYEGVSNPRNFKLFGGKVYFSATPVGIIQDELFITDGTTSGTNMVKDINPGSSGSDAGNFIVVNDQLFFTASHPSYGKELWKTDGTEAGTNMSYDVYEGSISSDPRIIKFNDDIIVTGTLTAYGRELFWIQMPPNPPFGLAAIALSTTSIQLNWTDISKSEDRFNIYYSTDGVNYSKYGSVNKDITTITLTGLLPNTQYWFKASGENDKGQNYTDPITRATRSLYSDFVLTSSPIENSDLCQIKATWVGNSTSYNLSYGDTVLSDIVGSEHTIPDLDCNKKYDISLTGRNVEGVFESPITLSIKTSKSNIVIVDEEVTPPIVDNNDNESNSNEDVEGTRLLDSVVEIAKAITTPEFANSAQEVALATGAATTLLQPAISGVSMFTNSLSLPNIFVLLGQFFNKILIFFGFKKQGRDFGYVYNSVTKAPISLAIVRFFNQTGELVTTTVTNSFGVFETDIANGKYKLVVSKSGFEFPSKLIIGENDGEVQNVYDGGFIDLEKEDISNLSIPLDPIEANNLFFVKRIFLQIIKYLSFGLFVIGFLYSCLVLYNYVNLYNFLILLVYAFIIHQYVFAWMYANRHGVVKKDGKPVKGIKIGLMLNSLNKIVDVRITDSEGKYKFIATPGEYQIVLNDSRYSEVSTNDKVFAITGKSPEVIYRNIEID